jgi:hypothetical protein
MPVKRLAAGGAVLLIGLIAVADAAEAPGCAPDNLAVGGHDVVSYFSPGGPVEGSDELTIELEGLTYRFHDIASLELFRANPHAYLPAYAGWCATTVAYGTLRCPDYTNFKIEDGRLLFFEITAFTNGRVVWDSDPVSHRQRADENFRALTAK